MTRPSPRKYWRRRIRVSLNMLKKVKINIMKARDEFLPPYKYLKQVGTLNKSYDTVVITEDLLQRLLKYC